MRSGTPRLHASALVDGHVNDDRALLHARHHLSRDDLGSGGAGYQHAADDQVGFARGAGNVVAVGGQGVDAAIEDVVDLAQAVQVQIDECDLGAHTQRDACSVCADDTATDYGDVRGRNAGNSAEKDAAAALLLFEVAGAHLHAHAPGHFA